MKNTRREFIKTGAAGAAAVAVSSKLAMATEALVEKAPDIAEVVGEKAAATRKAVEMLGGMGRFVKKDAKVVVKPNMGFSRTPDFGANTSPEVVAETVKMCLEAGARKVLVFDYPVHKGSLCLERSGIRDACASLDNTSIYTIDDKKFFQPITIADGRDLKKLLVAKDVLEADTFINVPAAKSHGGSIVTFGMKNLMGVIWDRRHFHVFADLHKCIAELASAVTPHLTIVDASRIMSTGGPGGPGKMIYKKTILAGTKPASVDAYAVTLSTWGGRKYKPGEIDHIRYASKRGLGEIDPARLRVDKHVLD